MVLQGSIWRLIWGFAYFCHLEKMNACLGLRITWRLKGQGVQNRQYRGCRKSEKEVALRAVPLAGFASLVGFIVDIGGNGSELITVIDTYKVES